MALYYFHQVCFNTFSKANINTIFLGIKNIVIMFGICCFDIDFLLIGLPPENEVSLYKR